MTLAIVYCLQLLEWASMLYMVRSKKERSVDEILFDNQSIMSPTQQDKPWEPQGFTIE